MSGSANSKYLESIAENEKANILKEIANHYGISLEDAYEEVIDEDAENLYEYMVSGKRFEVYRGMA